MSELHAKIAFPLLNTRLLPPPARVDLITRDRLYKKLARGLACPLVTVVAPPGFGKTTLVSGWLRTLSGPAAWVTLDPADNDPARFWGYFTAAIEKAYPVILNSISVPYQVYLGGAPMAPEANLASLINSLAGVTGDGIIVLDDFHLITTPLIISALSFFVEHLPANLHLMLISRSEPFLPLARLRARRQVIELHSSDLRFNPDEAFEFFNRVMGLPLNQTDVQQLEERTEGWIAGLQLAALTLLERENWQQALNEITGDNRYIQDYLVEEVFQHQPLSIQDFLLTTSILDRLCAPLCDALIGRPGSQEVLEFLEHANLFITPLDLSRRWYRYHPLLGDMLRSRLAGHEPQKLTRLHFLAARWYEANDDPSQAVSHYLSAGDAGQVAGLIKRQAKTLLNQNEMATLLSWFKAMPDEEVRSNPEISILYGWTLLYNARFAEVEGYLKSAEKILAEKLDPSGEWETWFGHIDAIRGTVAMNMGDEARGIELSQRALNRLPENEDLWRSILALNLGDGYVRLDEVDKALGAFQEAVSAARASGNTSSLFVIYGSQAALLTGLGRLDQAESVYRLALETAATGLDASMKVFPTLGKVNAFYSTLLYEWNRLDEAAEQARLGIERCSQWGHLEHLVDSSVAYAMAMQALSEGAPGLAALDRVELIVSNTIELLGQSGQLAENRKIRWTLDRIRRVRCTLAAVNGDFDPITSWMIEQGLIARSVIKSENLLSFDPAWRLLVARWLVREGRVVEGIEILEYRLDKVENSRWSGQILSVLVRLAVAYDSRHDQAQAVLTLERALALGMPQGYVRTFLDGGEPVRQILLACQPLKSQAQTRAEKIYLDRLITSFPSIESESAGNHSLIARTPGEKDELFEPLSLRELRILTLVSAGLSNQEIAAALIVSTNTVKTHLKRIYVKLMVSSRVEAVEKAHRLNLF